MQVRSISLLVAALVALAGDYAVAADNERQSDPIRLDVANAKKGKDGRYTAKSPFETHADGSITLPDGKKMSRQQVFDGLKNDPKIKKWTTPDGRTIDKNNVVLGKDGLYTKNGQRLTGGDASGGATPAGSRKSAGVSRTNLPTMPSLGDGGIPDVSKILGGANQQLSATAGNGVQSNAEASALAEAAAQAQQPRGVPRSAVRGISLISGGQGKDGVAATGVIPVLK